jgi:DNA processing protein
MDDLPLWLALRDSTAVERSEAFDLLRRYGSPRFVFGRRLPELGERSHALLRVPDLAAAQDELRRAAAAGLEVRVLGQDGFPPLLLQLPDPPLVLYARGRIPLPERKSLAVVGSRRASASGRAIARSLAGAAARAGVTIVSGLAYGIDAAAHEGALDAGGFTAAVLASGADRPSPAGNRALARRILESSGTLLSELPPGVPALAHHFPARNRLISALANAVLVVEARPGSGTLHTVVHAGKQNRAVLVVPGPIDVEYCRGSNALLRSLPVRPVTCAQDLLEELFGSAGAPRVAPTTAVESPARPEARRLLELLDAGPASVDALGAQSGLAFPALSAVLVELELGGWIERSGSRVARAGRLRG